MKNSFNLAERQQQVKEAEGWVKPQPCMVCGKVIPGAYGMWQAGWTCSLYCETLHTKGANRVHIEQAQRQVVLVGVETVPLVLSDVESEH